jgi:hypothetical protein
MEGVGRKGGLEGVLGITSGDSPVMGQLGLCLQGTFGDWEESLRGCVGTEVPVTKGTESWLWPGHY